MNKNPNPRVILLAGAGVAAVALIALLVPLFLRHTFSGTVLETPQPAHEFSLPSTLGRPLALSELRGKTVLLFFGYTFCPDVCPATLGNLKMALARLGGKADSVRVVFVSVDPERDTLPYLVNYLRSFDPQRMIGLSGEIAATREIATRYGIFFEKQATDNEGRYLVDHSASVLLIDAKGMLREVLPFGTTPEGFAADIEYFMK